MRLLFITKRYYTNRDLIGDRYGRLYHLPVELARLGHDVTVVALDYRTARDDETVLDGVAFKSFGVRTIRSLRLMRRLKSIGRQYLPDIVLASADTPIGWLGQRLARCSGVPFVFDIYDNYGAFASSWMPGIKALYSRLQSNADLVVVASAPLKRSIVEHGDRVLLIENGIDRSVFHPIAREDARRDSGVPLGIPVVGYFGSIEPARGFQGLMGAIAQVRLTVPNVVLLSAGAHRLDTLACPQWHDHRGEVPQADVPRLIASCDVVVLPYLKTEWGDFTYPNKLAEYVACGVPIVSSDASGFRELLEPAGAVVYPAGDSGASGELNPETVGERLDM